MPLDQSVWREVSAKRARGIRKRGFGFEMRYAGRTSTGKARYLWHPVYGIWIYKDAL